jgi:hypothetical protein
MQDPESCFIPRARRNVVLFNDTFRSKHFGCKLVMRELNALLRRRGLQPVWSQRVGRDWRPHEEAIRALPDPAAVIVNGEGTIHHTDARPNARALLEAAAFAHERLRAPAFLINATLHELAGEDARRLQEFDRVYVRESSSLREAERLGVSARVVPDLTLHAELPRRGGERRGVCATDNVVQEVADGIRELSRRRGWPYWPMSYARRHLRRQPPSVDRFLPSYLLVRLGVRDYAAALAGYLSGHRLLVSGRYHAVTYAMLTRTPFVAVESNTPKISSMLQDAFGDTRRIVPAERLAEIDVEEYAEWAPGELAALDAFCARARASAEAMFDDIAAQIAAGT